MRKNLVAKREQTGFTKAETAKAIGITRRQYDRLEAGTSDGSVKVWQKLKDLFKTPIDTLLEDTTKKGESQDDRGRIKCVDRQENRRKAKEHKQDQKDIE